MKKILIAATLCILTVPAFGQIDDVINKKPTRAEKEAIAAKKKAEKEAAKEERERLIARGELDRPLGEVFIKGLLSRFTQIEITTLVDNMKKDGVSERGYAASLNIDGRLINIDELDGCDCGGTPSEDDPKLEIIRFKVKLTTDKKVAISTSLASIKAGEYLDAQALVFVLDDGVSFRDVRSVGWRLVKANFNIPLAENRDGSGFIAVELGGELGGESETITLDNGQTLVIKNRHDLESISGAEGTPSALGFKYGLTGGLAFKDKVGKDGSILIRGSINYSSLGGGVSNQYDINHKSVYANPSVTYSRPLGKTSSISLRLSANIALKDQVKSTFEAKDQPKIDLNMGDRNRNPYNASLIIKF